MERFIEIKVKGYGTCLINTRYILSLVPLINGGTCIQPNVEFIEPVLTEEHYEALTTRLAKLYDTGHAMSFVDGSNESTCQ